MDPMRFKPYFGRILLTVLGLAAGILMLTLGFWKTMLLILMCALGYGLGYLKDAGINPLQHLPTQNLPWRK